MVTQWVARGGAIVRAWWHDYWHFKGGTIIGTLKVSSCGLSPRPGSGQTGGGGKGSGWWL